MTRAVYEIDKEQIKSGGDVAVHLFYRGDTEWNEQ